MSFIKRTNMFCGITFIIISFSFICIGFFRKSSFFTPTNITIIIMLILGMTLVIVCFIDLSKLNRLKKGGICYSVRLISIQPSKLIHIRGFFTFKIFGEYTDSNGKTHKIFTHMYSIKRNTSIITNNITDIFEDKVFEKINVYVDNTNLSIYATEVSFK